VWYAQAPLNVVLVLNFFFFFKFCGSHHYGALITSCFDQGLPYRTGPLNRRPPVPVNRSVSRGNRPKPNKFKIQIETPVQSISIDKPLGKDRLPVGLGDKPT
jgi:hypothetical protein